MPRLGWRWMRFGSWAFFPGATANEKLCDLLLLPENAQQHGMCGDSSSANSQRLFDRFEAL